MALIDFKGTILQGPKIVFKYTKINSLISISP
jgi:hypothetical protein